MEQDLSTYIDTELKKLYPVFQWKIIKNTEKKIVEVYITFHTEVNESLQVQDIIGQANTPGTIQFEDVICFYDPAAAHVKPQSYLASIAMDNLTGIEKGAVDACLKQLNIVAEEGITELQNFAADDVSGEFKLNWNDRDYESTVQTMKELERYNDEKIKMMLDQEESFIDQIKKDESNDGVERV